MKFTAATFVVLCAGIYALPQDEVGQDVEVRLNVTNWIQQAVNDMNQQIMERGWDPWVAADRLIKVDTCIGGVDAHMEGLVCSGLAHNFFTRLSFNTFTMRLNFELVWPRIACELKSSGVTVAVIRRELDALNSGVVELVNTSVGGSIRVRARPSSGVSIIDCNLDFNTIVQSNLNVKWQGRDISDHVNGRVEALNRIFQYYKDALGRLVCAMLEEAT